MVEDAQWVPRFARLSSSACSFALVSGHGSLVSQDHSELQRGRPPESRGHSVVRSGQVSEREDEGCFMHRTALIKATAITIVSPPWMLSRVTVTCVAATAATNADAAATAAAAAATGTINHFFA
jgi:hypothetical protein